MMINTGSYIDDNKPTMTRIQGNHKNTSCLSRANDGFAVLYDHQTHGCLRLSVSGLELDDMVYSWFGFN